MCSLDGIVSSPQLFENWTNRIHSLRLRIVALLPFATASNSALYSLSSAICAFLASIMALTSKIDSSWRSIVCM